MERRELVPDRSFQLTEAELRRRLAGFAPAAERGDHSANPGMQPLGLLREAAVLVPLVLRPDGVTVLLTERTLHLANHAGQIAFPGGRVDPTDAGPVAAALREAEEEVGLARCQVEVVARLDRYVTRTGFAVTPVVGLVRPPLALAPNPHEVARIFEVPLAFLLDPANAVTEGREFGGVVRRFTVFGWPGHGEADPPARIWGATAGMLLDLAERLA